MPAQFSYKNDSDEDQRLSPEETGSQLHDQEQQSGYDRDFDALTNPEHLKKDGVEGDKGVADDNGDAVRDAEDSGGNWKSNYGGNKSEPNRKLTLKNVGAIFKKRGAIGVIAALVLGGGGFAAILGSPALLFFQIQESLVSRFDSQNTSMTIRTNKVISSKILGDTTQGSCDVVKIACRFTRPSNSFLKNMEKNGVRALRADGSVVDKTQGLFPNERPVSYEFTSKNGDKITVAAKDFSKTLQTNPEFRSAFHRTYNPRFTAFSDSVFKSIEKRFGFKKTNSLAEAKTEEDVKKSVSEGSKGADSGARAAAAEGTEEAAEGVLEKLIKAQATKSLEVVKKAGKGGASSVIIGTACLATNIPGSVISITRAYQMTQLVLFSSKYLTVASGIKAGDSAISNVVISGLGNSLTETKDGVSAMESLGMNYAMFGDTSTKYNSYKKFAPGSAAVGALGGVNQVTSSTASKQTCATALNPVTGAAINATLVAAGGATFGTTAAAALVNLAAGFVLSEAVNLIAPYIAQGIATALAPYFKDVLGLLLGDLTANLSGVDVGDALASGSAHLMGQTANAGGNMPLTVDQAVAYNASAKDVQLAYAEEDRATLSPLDGTNKNTFVGSLVSNLLPYYSQLGSVSGALKTLGSIPAMSLGSILQPSKVSAESTAAQYEMCDDPAITAAEGGGVAAGPFCNIEYGIPTEYLDMDPEQVVNTLVASGDIDENTGKPVELPNGNEEGQTTSLKGWMDLCTDGTTDQAANCRITDEKTAMYAVYTVDHRIQRTMDDMDEVTDTQKSSATGSIVAPVAAGFRLSSGFGPRVSPCSTCSSYHKGLDFIGGDQIVHATMDGTVISVGGDVNNTVTIQHADGLISQYLHMELSNITVKKGDVVTANQIIGKMGNVGQSTGTHLHYQLKITGVSDPSLYAGYTQNSGFIDPAQFFIKNGIGGFS